MMNNITNTMCRLSDLTQEQIDSLVAAMPDSHDFDFGNYECFIGFTLYGKAGTWRDENDPKIISYTEMMQLLKGKDMNKQTAQEQMAVMQIEMDKLKAIINKPEVKTGRVLAVGELWHNDRYYVCTGNVSLLSFSNDLLDSRFIEAGIAFHDEETAKRHLEYLKLEQELRRAQIADGGGGEKVIAAHSDNAIISLDSIYHHKVSFTTDAARDAFIAAHTIKQIILLIRGV
jgi:hypothetical protein